MSLIRIVASAADPATAAPAAKPRPRYLVSLGDKLTFYCDFRDIHARTVGYKLIADLIASALPERPRHR